MKRLLLFVVLCAGLTLCAPLLVADEVPITSQTYCCFYSVQLHGISFGPTGELVEVFVWDMTGDSPSGHVKITDTSTNTVLINKTYGDLGGVCCNVSTGKSTSDQFTLPYNKPLLIKINDEEYSQAAIYYGDTLEASGGTYTTGGHTPVYPSYTTTLTITAPQAVPEPGILILLGSGLLGIAKVFRSQTRRTR